MHFAKRGRQHDQNGCDWGIATWESRAGLTELLRAAPLERTHANDLRYRVFSAIFVLVAELRIERSPRGARRGRQLSLRLNRAR